MRWVVLGATKVMITNCLAARSVWRQIDRKRFRAIPHARGQVLDI